LVTARVKEEEHQPYSYSSVKDEDTDGNLSRGHNVKISTKYTKKKEEKVMATKQTSTSHTNRKMVCDQIEYTDLYIKQKKFSYDNVKIEVKGEDTDDEDTSPTQFSNTNSVCIKAEEVKGEDTDDDESVVSESTTPQSDKDINIQQRSEKSSNDNNMPRCTYGICTNFAQTEYVAIGREGVVCSKHSYRKPSGHMICSYDGCNNNAISEYVCLKHATMELREHEQKPRRKKSRRKKRPRGLTSSRCCSHSGRHSNYALVGGTLCFRHDPRKKRSRSSSLSALSQANVMLILMIVVCCLLMPVSSFSPRGARLVTQQVKCINLITMSSGKSVDKEPSSSADISSTSSKPYKRRERYSGRYPRNFKDRYKEQRGDEETINKVLAKGITPAGTHVPIMVKECLHYMGLEDTNDDVNGQRQQPQPLLVVDCTLGYGGHSSYILKHLMKNDAAANGSRLISFDQDSVEIKKTEERLRTNVLNQTSTDESRTKDEDLHSNLFTAVNQNFANLGPYLSSTQQTGQVTSLLADLGLSSMQIDNNDRGFTYKREGPLDMRMDPVENTETAYDLLKRLRVRKLKSMLKENSDEEFAAEIAVGLIGKGNTIPSTTLELADRVRDIMRPLIMKQNNWNEKQGLGKNQMKKMKSQTDSTIARVMQAIRIEVNGEFEVLDKLLEDVPKALSPGGRVVFLTFHSGEDRRVKKSFKTGFKSGIYSSWSRDVVRPTSKERRDNPRSSCCKLRWAVRSDKPVDDNNSEVELVKTIDPSLNDQVDWNDRVGMQAKWTNKEKGWKVDVEWKLGPFGAGLFACQDIPNGTILRVGKNGVNLVGFKSIEDIESFCGGEAEDKEVYNSKLNYVKDYMWGFSASNTDDRGYDIDTPDNQEKERFFGMWCPGNGLNHNTNPNTVYRASANGGTDDGINLVAIRDIKAGDELFDDYRRHGSAPGWLLQFAKQYNVTLNFAECNDFVEEE